MFKRKPRSYTTVAQEFVYPRGGWRRASRYMIHRVRRLPDRPSRVGRGVAAGVFVSFTPLFGFHFLSAAAVAWLIGGNILAALLATFIGNPLTAPFIAALSVSLGRRILGIEGRLSPGRIFEEFGLAGGELWKNLQAPFTDATAKWDHLTVFLDEIYWPYFVGGVIPGLIVATICHFLTVPLVRGHHRRKARKMAARVAKLNAKTAEGKISSGHKP